MKRPQYWAQQTNATERKDTGFSQRERKQEKKQNQSLRGLMEREMVEHRSFPWTSELKDTIDDDS